MAALGGGEASNDEGVQIKLRGLLGHERWEAGRHPAHPCCVHLLNPAMLHKGEGGWTAVKVSRIKLQCGVWVRACRSMSSAVSKQAEAAYVCTKGASARCAGNSDFAHKGHRPWPWQPPPHQPPPSPPVQFVNAEVRQQVGLLQHQGAQAGGGEAQADSQQLQPLEQDAGLDALSGNGGVADQDGMGLVQGHAQHACQRRLNLGGVGGGWGGRSQRRGGGLHAWRSKGREKP